MKTLSLEKNLPGSAAGRSRGIFYIPERLTPLAFTGIYRELSAVQRARYNQLSGLYFLEQTIFFEQCMGRPVLERLEQTLPASLRAHAREFIAEENRHTVWFRQLLRDCEPQWYAEDCFRLLKAGPLSRAALHFCTQRPDRFPCLLWLQIMAEERAQYFGGAFVAEAGELDERFVEVQRRHLADEGGHIRWDVEFIEWLWPATPLLLRKWNARLLGWLLREFFHLPKRSGWNVVEHLLAEFPELAARKAELRAAMRSLARNGAYLHTLYPRSVFPRTRRLASRWPELHFLDEFFTE
jgi:P-aminobenzoate N-oxygenase AurF